MKRFNIYLSILMMLLSPLFMVAQIASAVGVNLVANPSMETLSTSDATQPADWYKGK
jgi:hypothetical protein